MAARAHTHTHPHTHTNAYAHTHKHVRTHARTHMHTNIHTHTHAHTHTETPQMAAWLSSSCSVLFKAWTIVCMHNSFRLTWTMLHQLDASGLAEPENCPPVADTHPCTHVRAHTHTHLKCGLGLQSQRRERIKYAGRIKRGRGEAAHRVEHGAQRRHPWIKQGTQRPSLPTRAVVGMVALKGGSR